MPKQPARPAFIARSAGSIAEVIGPDDQPWGMCEGPAAMHTAEYDAERLNRAYRAGMADALDDTSPFHRILRDAGALKGDRQR